MPKRRRRSKKAAAPSGEDDRISALPEALLLTVLASLPSEEAVRTCVLSRRWRHLWKSTPAVRVFRDGDAEWCTTKLKNFLNNLLYLRDPLPLDECDISCSQLMKRDDHEGLLDFAESWVRKAVTLYQARVVKICIRTDDYYLDLNNFPFVSQRLVRMELTRALLYFRNLDFSACPALEDLELAHCTIYTDRILSQSLRRLSITGGFLDERTPRTRISAPGLISLRVAGVSGRAFFLENMPLLETAFVRLNSECYDYCKHKIYGGCQDDCLDARYNGDGSNTSVILQALSNATNLELTSNPRVFLFRKDCTRCPTFSKLKTLLLNEWCVTAGLGALVNFLQHTPILENLTFQIPRYKERIHWIVPNESFDPMEHLFLLKHLKSVKIKCGKEDDEVQKIVKILGTFGVPYERIAIQVIPEILWSTQSFSFEKTRQLKVGADGRWINNYLII